MGAAVARRPARPRARRASRVRQLVARRSSQRRSTRAQIVIPPGPRLGDDVIERRGQLSKGFGDRLLIDNLTFKLPPGGIVGIIGPNGAGKTTLFKMITGQESPTRAPSSSATR
jgi:ATPase subunit of ABC transporter with duplicated ATPase domains